MNSFIHVANIIGTAQLRGVTANIAIPKIDFVKPADTDKDFAVGASEPSATQIEFGLWDHLISPGGSQFTKTDENQNVIGSDSRRFYIRVRDDGAKGKGFVEVDWWTAFTNSDNRVAGTVQDDPKSVLNLFEVAASPGVFTSRGLMLVDDQTDRSIQTDSGIPSGDPKLGSQAGNRADTQSNYRIRRCGMHSFVVASYTPKTGMAKPATVIAPVFLPANRKLMPVQVYVLRVSKGGSPCIPTADLFAKDLRAITETFERIGIWFYAHVTAADDGNAEIGKVQASPPQLPYKICVVDPPAGVDPAKVDVPAVGALGRAFPAGAPNTMRLFFVTACTFSDLQFKPTGRAFGIRPDSSPVAGCSPTPADPADTAGIAIVQANRGDDFTASHELGHLLTNKSKMRKGKLDPDQLLDSCIEDSHYRASVATALLLLRVKMNLMNGLGPRTSAPNVFDPKRIWDELDDDSVNQLLNIRSSPFLR